MCVLAIITTIFHPTAITAQPIPEAPPEPEPEIEFHYPVIPPTPPSTEATTDTTTSRTHSSQSLPSSPITSPARNRSLPSSPHTFQKYKGFHDLWETEVASQADNSEQDQSTSNSPVSSNSPEK